MINCRLPNVEITGDYKTHGTHLVFYVDPLSFFSSLIFMHTECNTNKVSP